jgi:beta-galactosidase
MIYDLTGNEIEFFDTLLPDEPGKAVMDGKEYSWNTWGEILKPGKESEIWATYEDEFYEDRPAVTSRRLGKGTVTYIGLDSHDGKLEKDILAKVYDMIDIPVMNLPYGVTLEYRNGFGIVLNYSDKSYEFSLPKGAKILIGDKEIPVAGVLVFSI